MQLHVISYTHVFCGFVCVQSLCLFSSSVTENCAELSPEAYNGAGFVRQTAATKTSWLTVAMKAKAEGLMIEISLLISTVLM